MKHALCPCCRVELQINIRPFGESYLSYPDADYAWEDDIYDDYRNMYDDAWEDMRDDYEDELSYQDEIDREWEALQQEAFELANAYSAQICTGGNKARRHARFERCKDRRDKMNHKRPAAQRSFSEAVMQKRMAKWSRDFRFAIEMPHSKFPKHTKEGD